MVKDLLIKNYNNVPEMYKGHIPNPELGHIKLKYQENNVNVYIEDYIVSNYSNSGKPRCQFKETISKEQADYFCKLIDSWNSIIE